MQIDIHYEPEEELVYIKYHGKMSYVGAKDTILYLQELSKNNCIRGIISDHSDILSFPGTVDVFNLGSQVSHLLKGIHIATIVRKELMEDYNMYLHTIKKRGGNIRLFDNKDSAVKWLNDLKSNDI